MKFKVGDKVRVREALLKEIDKLNNLEGEVIEVIKEFM